MTDDLRYFEAVAHRALAHRSKRSAEEADVRRKITRVKLAARVPTPPTNLVTLAKHLKVAAIRHVPLAMKARLVLGTGGINVEINTELSEFERQLALAHELAHVILEGPRIELCAALGQGIRAPSAWARTRIEQLCDLAAAELLLPLSWLRDKFRKHVPSLSLARTISEDSHCDVDFLLAHALDAGLWRCRLLWIERHGQDFVALRTHPEVEESFLSSLRVTDEPTTLFLQRVSDDGPNVAAGTLTLSSKDGKQNYRVECTALRPGSILCVLIHE